MGSKKEQKKGEKKRRPSNALLRLHRGDMTRRTFRPGDFLPVAFICAKLSFGTVIQMHFYHVSCPFLKTIIDMLVTILYRHDQTTVLHRGSLSCMKPPLPVTRIRIHNFPVNSGSTSYILPDAQVLGRGGGV